MSDLISRTLVMDWLRELQAQAIINENHGTLVDVTISSTVNHFMNFIVQLPTAYDVDRIAEELEELLVDVVTIGDPTAINHWNEAIMKSISIVKAGGIE